MLPVSLDWQKAIRQPIRGQAFLKVQFEVIAPGALENATASASSTSPISKASNVLVPNVVQAKVATLEPERWIDNGTFELPTDNRTDVGWWSETSALPQTLKFTFSRNFKSPAVTITWDTTTNSWATNFKVIAKDASGGIIDEVTVTNNTSLTTVVEGNFVNFWSIDIVVTGWSKANWRVRVSEVYFGFVKAYTDDDFFSASQYFKESPVMSYLPEFGFQMTLNNYTRQFNPENLSGISGFLQQYQKISVHWGFETSPNVVEWLPCGVYYLKEWQTESNILEASLISQDLLSFATIEYDEGIYDGNGHTVKELATKILQFSGIDQYATGTPWVLPDDLNNYTTDIPLPRLPCNELLQLLAQMTGYIIRMDNLTGDIIFQRAQNTLVYNDISGRNELSQPSISLDPELRQVQVNVNRPHVTTEVTSIFKETFTVTNRLEFDILTDAPYANLSINITGTGVTLQSFIPRAYKSTVILTGTGTIEVEMTGKEILISQLPMITYNNPNIAGGEILKVENPLIASIEIGEEVGARVASLAKIRQRVSCNWQGDPSIQPADIYRVQTHFGWVPSIITESTLNYQGAWTGSIKGIQTIPQPGLPENDLITGAFDAGPNRRVQVLERR